MLYTRIPIWENRRRVAVLKRFRQLVADYEANIEFPSWMAGTTEPHENEHATMARTDINFLLEDVHRIIYAASLRPVVTWTPPPAIGGYVQQVSIFENLFG